MDRNASERGMQRAPVEQAPARPLSAANGSAEKPPPGDVLASADALAFLGRRFSVGPKYLHQPAPSQLHLQQAALVALRAPDHGGLRPFRFVCVEAEQREILGSLFAQHAAARGHGAEEVERARQRAYNGPALIALVGRIQDGVDQVPTHEQWLCIGAGLMNFLNALHLQGYAAKTLSGTSVAAPAIQRAFCDPGETLLAWILAGTPLRSAHAKRADDATAILTSWQPAKQQ